MDRSITCPIPTDEPIARGVGLLGDTNLSMVLATMVEDLLSDHNLIGVSPHSTRSGGYTLIVRAMAIVGWSAVVSRRNQETCCRRWPSIQGTSASAAQSPTKVRIDHLFVFYQSTPWPIEAPSMVSTAGVGNGVPFKGPFLKDEGTPSAALAERSVQRPNPIHLLGADLRRFGTGMPAAGLRMTNDDPLMVNAHHHDDHADHDDGHVHESWTTVP